VGAIENNGQGFGWRGASQHAVNFFYYVV